MLTNITNSRNRFAQLMAMLLLAAGLLASAPAAAWANNDGTDEYYRVNDFCELIPDSDADALSTQVKAEVRLLKMDFGVYVSSKADPILDWTRGFYEKNNCGYGPGNDGVMLGYNPTTGKCAVYACGSAKKLFTDEYRAKLEKAFLRDVKANPQDAIYNFLRYSIRKVAKAQGQNVDDRWPALTAPEGTEPGGTASATNPGSKDPDAPKTGTEIYNEVHGVKTTKDLDWYPADAYAFKPFHDEKAPRVVDNADLLTDQEEADLKARLKDMRQRLNMDFVFVSDVSSYGLSRELFAQDYYKFNGYGVGEKYDGVIFFVCMEDGNRGFVTAACGNAEGLMTESNLNKLDDRVIDLFKEGRYAEGISKRFTDLDSLYTDGHLPFNWGGLGLGCFGGLVFGCFMGFTNLGRKRHKMKTVAKAAHARQYANGGVEFTVSTDVNAGTTYTRVPYVDPDKGSGGGGGSSFFSGSGGSGGGGSHSFSGGGRGF
ncbi:MAG: TPM domain-containing protein [Coriobacteriia bacterium]|nr:TPM domain-containing protein [Coriobacteriia bacterium]